MEPEQEGLFISVYKAKVRTQPTFHARIVSNDVQGERELIAHHNLAAFKSCEIRALMHRKGGHTLPTLMLEFKPESLSDKARKRRSSRTSGLTTKDPWTNILLFRSVADDRYNIHDWLAMLRPQLTPESPADSMIMPEPQFHQFSNPFASREISVRRSDIQSRATERNPNSYPHAPRDRPSAIISPSPSLRSRRSDLSSQASSQHPMGFTNAHAQIYTATLPPDLPSPASTSYETQFIEGWTSAQGRSSALSSHTRGSNSIASAAPPSINQFASTPPGPRETILDRAFQMKCIPGSERISEDDEDQLTSLARFEALMREVDEKKFDKNSPKSNGQSKDVSEWNLDDDSGDDSDSGEPGIDNESSDEVDGLEFSDDEDVRVPPQTQSSMEYTSGRRTPIPGRRPLSPAPSTPPMPYLNTQATSAFHGSRRTQSPLGLRPRTGTNPTPTSNHFSDNHFQRFLPTRSQSSANVAGNASSKVISRPELPHRAETLSADTNLSRENRKSRDSVKRLSFQEFTQRLSSTSSLLLVQTNVSNGGTSGRTSFEVGGNPEQKQGERPEMKARTCSWRGSVGAFGGEGGFL